MNLLKRLRLFTDDNRGSIPTEGVLAFTMLIWWYLASFQFFDAFRQKNINLKAAYTIADLISRQTDAIEDFVGVKLEHLPGFRQHDAAAIAIEKFDAKLLFERPNLPRYQRLRHGHLQSSLGEASGRIHGGKYL